MRPYTHFTATERESLRVMRSENKSMHAIARKLGRNVSSISREVKRNSNRDGSYNVWRAISLYIHRRKRCVRKQRVLVDTQLREFICKNLGKHWSPEVIATKWNRENPKARTGHSTIYAALKKKLLPGCSEREHLMRRGRRKYSRGAINPVKPLRNIAERPEEAQLRSRIGDWEGDTVQGKKGSGGLVTFVDRMSRRLRMRLIQGPISAEAVTKATAEALKDQPVYTLTLDNGAEFAGHQSIEAQLGAAVYFTDPHSPWQRPSNENTNGLLRFFFPKGFDFSTTTPEYVAEIEELLDTRPRKCLDYLSPLDFFTKCCT